MNNLCITSIFNWITEKISNLIMNAIEKVGEIADNIIKSNTN